MSENVAAGKKASEPPPLVALGARVVQLESERRLLFTKWLAALATAQGNVVQAGLATFPDRDPKRAKSYGEWLTRKFKLAEYAAALRVAAGHTERGRPWPKAARRRP